MVGITLQDEGAAFYVPATAKLPPVMPRFTKDTYGRFMAVLRWQTQHVHLPSDFGLGLLVTSIIGGLLLTICVAVMALPTHGPRGETHTPEGNTTYVDIAPPSAAPAVLPTP